MKKSESVIRSKSPNHQAEKIDYSAYKISNPDIDIVIYSYKSKRQGRKNKSAGRSLFSSAVSEAVLNFSTDYVSPDRFSLKQNSADPFSKRVVIEFYLPVDSKIELILLNSNKEDELFLINQEMKAGHYTFTSDISNDELKYFRYYYKLNASGYSEIREMKYSNQC